MKRCVFGLLCITMLLCAASSVRALEFRIHDLGLPGTQAKAVDINNVGQIIARSYDESDYTTAFLWSGETGLVDIGSQQFNVPHAINDVGQIAGERATQPDWNPYFAVIRDSDGSALAAT